MAGDGEASPANAPAPLLSLGLRCTLIPPRVVGFVAKILAPLFFPPIVVAVLSGFILIDVVLFAHHSVTGSLVTVLARPGLLVGTIGIVAGAMLFHELGHAAACSYGGGRPGRVGMGVYTLLPAFFTNVNDSYRLSRAARLRVDLGGIYFNAIFVLASGTYAWRTGSAVALAVTGLVLLGMLQQLLPLGRLDGYFVVSDLVGVPDLFNRIGPALRGIPDTWPRRPLCLSANASSGRVAPKGQVVRVGVGGHGCPCAVLSPRDVRVAAARFCRCNLGRGVTRPDCGLDWFRDTSSGRSVVGGDLTSPARAALCWHDVAGGTHAHALRVSCNADAGQGFTFGTWTAVSVAGHHRAPLQQRRQTTPQA